MNSRQGSKLSVAQAAARAGGEEALSLFRTELESENKVAETDRIVNPGDVVTAADRRAQQTVIETIEANYPDDTIVGEEDDALKTVPETGVAWVIDPIDGTYNFARGNSYWTTSIAVVRNGDPIGAVNFIPALSDMYTAGPNGVERNGNPITVSDRPEPKYSTVATPGIPDFGHREQFADGIREIVNQFGNLRRYGSAQVALALVAGGIIEGVVTDYRLNPWDTIAGAYMIEQAGGTVTDIYGDEWNVTSHGIVASNGKSHEALLQIGQLMAGSHSAT